MSSLKSEIIIFPEESEKMVKVELEEIPITISEFENIDVASTDNIVLITSKANVKLRFTKSESKSISIPDLSAPVRGTLRLEPDAPVIELRELPNEEARALILDYITDNHGAKTSDIVFSLGLDVKLVLGILKELNEKEQIIPVETQ